MFGYVESSNKRRTNWLPVPILGDEPTVVEGKLRRKTVIRGGIAIPIKSGRKQAELPEAYLQLVAKDTSGKIVSLQTAKLGKAAFGNWQELQLTYQAKEHETVEVSLVNGSDRVSALFDDLVLTTEPPLIVQENHYDPWGLNLAGIEVTGNPEHKWQFNGQEKQTEFGLNWQSYRFRDYDPQTARFMRPDPIGEKFNDLTLYQFARNNAASNIEIEGLEGAQKALLDEMQMYESIFKGTGEKVIDRLRSFSNTLREFTSNLASLPEQNIIIYGSGGLSGYIEMGKDTPGKGKYATIDLGKGNDIMFMIELYKPEEIETFTGGANDIWDLVLANDDPINQRFGWDGHYYNHHRKYRKSVIYDDVQIEGQDIYADNDSRNIPKDKDGNEMFYVVSIPTTNEDGATSYKLHRFSPQGLEALLNMGKRENEKIERQKNIVR